MEIKDWETIGIKEEWLEKGMTEKQMMNRIKELKLPIPKFCILQPFYLNYMQRPDMNELILKMKKETEDLGIDDSAWIAASNLWTPGQTINIVFSNSTHQEFIKAVLIKDLQPNVSMKLNFPGGSSGDIIVNVISMSGSGGNSALGKTGRQQTINLNSNSMSNADLSAIKPGGTSGRQNGFSWARYLVCHEFGHALGLYHEWNREMCGRNGVTCLGAQDMYSVMNYPAGSSGGAGDAKPSQNTMDTYSPEDVKWLQRVYKGGGGTTTDTTPSTTTTTPSTTTTTPSTTPKPKITPKPKPKLKPKPKGGSGFPLKQFDTLIDNEERTNLYIYIIILLGIIIATLLLLMLIPKK
jgi:Metallo-peptidase family M12B Reprolysin-like